MYPISENPALSEEFFIKEAKYRIIQELLDKLPFDVSYRDWYDGKNIVVKLDVVIKDTKEYIKDRYKNIKNPWPDIDISLGDILPMLVNTDKVTIK